MEPFEAVDRFPWMEIDVAQWVSSCYPTRWGAVPVFVIERFISVREIPCFMATLYVSMHKGNANSSAQKLDDM
jgi:hypothetical protein